LECFPVVSASGNKPSVKKGTPKAKSPKTTQITPAKGAPKRPLNDSDESSDESELNATASESMLNGVSKNKDKCSKLKKPVVSVPETSSERSPPGSYLLIPHPPRDLTSVKQLLATRNIMISDIKVLHQPVAIAIMDSEKGVDSALLNKPLSLDGNTVHLIQVSGSKEAMLALCDEGATKTLFVTGIPKSVSMDSLKAALPSDCRACSVTLLSQGPRNKFSNAAFLNFASPELASKAMNSLANERFEGRTLRVIYGKDKPVRFPSLEARREALRGPKFIAGQKLTVTVAGGIDRNIAIAKNLPFDCTNQDVQALFPEATSVSIDLRKDGKSSGTATVIFPTAELCQKATSTTYTVKDRKVVLFFKRVDIAQDPSQKQAPKKEMKPQKEMKPPQKAAKPKVTGVPSTIAAADSIPVADSEIAVGVVKVDAVVTRTEDLSMVVIAVGVVEVTAFEDVDTLTTAVEATVEEDAPDSDFLTMYI
uniref:RRM domain-containing protein n=1 Tax=Echinostoma caproni TaxID=27848 RepID=A0A183B858_9TREM